MSKNGAKNTNISFKNVIFSHFWKLKKKANDILNWFKTILLNRVLLCYEVETTKHILKCIFMPEKNCQKNKNSYWGVKFYVFNYSIKNVIYPQNWWRTSFVKFMSYRIRKKHQLLKKNYIHVWKIELKSISKIKESLNNHLFGYFFWTNCFF